MDKKDQKDQMDREEAKLLLSGYRPNGRDAQDPEMRQALELAQHDPALAEWFRREQEWDGVCCEKLCECPAPESLKASIIAGRKLVGGELRWKAPQLLALAAVLLLVVGLAALLYPRLTAPSAVVVEQSTEGFDAFRADMVRMLHAGFDLDVKSADSRELDMWLVEHATPLAETAAAAQLAGQAMGCKSLKWGSHSVSMLCYRIGEGNKVHLFVMNVQPGQVAGIPRENTKVLETVEKLSTAAWQENGKAYLLVAHDPGIPVTPFL
jgi:hypothetical protein